MNSFLAQLKKVTPSIAAVHVPRSAAQHAYTPMFLSFSNIQDAEASAARPLVQETLSSRPLEVCLGRCVVVALTIRDPRRLRLLNLQWLSGPSGGPGCCTCKDQNLHLFDI